MKKVKTVIVELTEEEIGAVIAGLRMEQEELDLNQGSLLERFDEIRTNAGKFTGMDEDDIDFLIERLQGSASSDLFVNSILNAVAVAEGDGSWWVDYQMLEPYGPSGEKANHDAYHEMSDYLKRVYGEVSWKFGAFWRRLDLVYQGLASHAIWKRTKEILEQRGVRV